MSEFFVMNIFMLQSMVSSRNIHNKNNNKYAFNNKGNTKGIRFESGDILDMSFKICETLKDENHVWVILKGIKETFVKIMFYFFTSYC